MLSSTVENPVSQAREAETSMFRRYELVVQLVPTRDTSVNKEPPRRSTILVRSKPAMTDGVRPILCIVLAVSVTLMPYPVNGNPYRDTMAHPGYNYNYLEKRTLQEDKSSQEDIKENNGLVLCCSIHKFYR